ENERNRAPDAKSQGDRPEEPLRLPSARRERHQGQTEETIDETRARVSERAKAEHERRRFPLTRTIQSRQREPEGQQRGEAKYASHPLRRVSAAEGLNGGEVSSHEERGKKRPRLVGSPKRESKDEG